MPLKLPGIPCISILNGFIPERTCDPSKRFHHVGPKGFDRKPSRRPLNRRTTVLHHSDVLKHTNISLVESRSRLQTAEERILPSVPPTCLRQDEVWKPLTAEWSRASAEGTVNVKQVRDSKAIMM